MAAPYDPAQVILLCSRPNKLIYSHPDSSLITTVAMPRTILKGPLFNGLCGEAHCHGDSYQGNGYQAMESFLTQRM